MTKFGLYAGVAASALFAPLTASAQQKTSAPQAELARQTTPTPVTPQDQPTPPVTTLPPQSEEADADAAGDIVVMGFRESYADALSDKRTSDQITDSISSDGLGRFPDLNVGEALQRLPGVQLSRDADARNATINLRGLPGTFARTTLNGAGFADPILSNAFSSGSTPLGAFNSDIFSSITVIKSPDASNIAGGLSGNIDLRIAPALSRREGGFLKGSMEYNELGSSTAPAIAAGYNWRVSSDLAVFGIVSYSSEDFRRDGLSINNWTGRVGAIQVGNQLAAGANPTFDALAAQNPGGLFYPGQIRQFAKINKGDMLTGAGGVEWRMSPEWKVGVSGFYTKRDLSDVKLHVQIASPNAGSNINTAINTSSAVNRLSLLGTPFTVQRPDGPRNYIDTFSVENLLLTDSTRDNPQMQQTWAITPAIEFKNELWHMELEGAVSRAKSTYNEVGMDITQVPFRNRGPAGPNGVSATFYSGGTDLSDLSFAVGTPNVSHIPAGNYTTPAAPNTPGALTVPMPGQAATILGNRFSIYGLNAEADNQLNAAQFKLQRKFESFISSVQVGARWENNRFISRGWQNTALGIDPRVITNDVSLANPYLQDFFGGEAPGFNRNWRTINLEQVLGVVRPVNTQPRSAANPYGLPDQFRIEPNSGVFVTEQGLINNYYDANYFNTNFINENHIWSAFGLARFDGDILGIRVRGNGGLRYEKTDVTISALECQNCSAARSTQTGPLNHRQTARTYKDDYGYLLPSFMFSADLTRKLVLRGAYYKTYVRPQPRDTVPITAFIEPDLSLTGTQTFTAQIGANDLKPYTANSYDMTLEWYNRKNGLFAVALYQKDISGFIGQITDQAILCPVDGRFNGIDSGFGQLQITSLGCQVVGNANSRVVATGIANLQDLRVRGAEVSVQQNLDFLPGFLKNLGGVANYSYTSISGVDGSGNKLILPGVSGNNINLIGYYETKPFGIRLVYNWRDKFEQPGGNTFLGDARTVAARTQFDASATFRLIKNMTLSLDAFNLTNTLRAEYEIDPRLPRRLDNDGRTYRATIRTSF